MNPAFFKKHSVFVISLLIAALLLGGVGFGLYCAMRRYVKQAGDLNAISLRVRQLHARDPYPIQENVRRESENLQDMVDAYNELNEMLRAEQVNPQPMGSADFLQFLEKSLRRQRALLHRAHIKFPDKYTFGFERYAGGQMPSVSFVPRLVQQLKVIEYLCELLPRAAITELVSVEREEFEASAPTAAAPVGRRGGAAAAAPVDELPDGHLFVRQSYKIAFRAGESAMFKFFNLLAAQPMFIVITKVEVVNPRQEFNSGPAPILAAASAAPLRAGGDGGSERRLLLGREELEVRVEFDVYNFAPSLETNGRTRK